MRSIRPFILIASDHGPLIVNRLDFHQLSTGATYGVGHQILSSGSYDSSEIARVLSELNELRIERGASRPIVALDCGANIGVHTVEMATEMAEWGRVIAIEAQERLFYALCGNIALNNLFNASAVFCAVGAERGQMGVPQPNYSRPASFGSLELQRGSRTEYIGQSISYADRDLTIIPVTNIDSLVDDKKLSAVDFIKLDVEGMEMDALTGALRTVTAHKPVLLIEWIKSDRVQLESFLLAREYEVTELGANLLAKPRS